MSRQKDDEDSEEEQPRLPTFGGSSMPSGNAGINFDNDDDIGEETTRRIGGAPTFRPTFEPVMMGAPQIRQPDSSISRIQQKQPQVVQAAPKVKVAAVPPTPSSSVLGGWKLKNAPTLPKFHPLDRASVFCPHTSVPTVASRIADALKERSIEGHFDNSRAKAKCLTSYNVDFRVFLYRGQKSYSHGVIVEVQRRNGASVLFFEDSQAILDAAQGKPIAPAKETTTAEIPLVEDDEFDDTKAALSSLQFVEKMLMHERYDATLLGLQTLSSLTDPAKMGQSTSKSVSESIVTAGNPVGGKVFEIITTRNSLDSEETEIHYDLAMSITANVLRNVSGNISSFHRSAIRPILIRDMENAEKKPQRAFAALRCLDSLIASDEYPTDLYGVLEKCKDVGEAKHSALRVQAEKCIRLIDGLR